ncbi:MAG: rhodanese-like domain-containing protein [Alistipes sp.]|nr:rhodanese-like domain-containing protein [Alistipes sp.]
MRKMLYVLFAATILVSCGTNRNKGYDSVDADSFAKFIGNEQVQLIDSRTPEEFNSGHIPGAININIDDENFRAKVNELDKSRPIAVYCRGGRRSKEAADIMAGCGYDVTELSEGIISWKGEIEQ